MSQIDSSPLLASVCAVVISGCIHGSDDRVHTALLHRPTPVNRLVAQVGFGDAARYGLCIPPACPTVTAKHGTSSHLSVDDRPASPRSLDEGLSATATQNVDTPGDVLSVYFDSGKAVLDVQARHAIDSLVASTPVRRVRIAAHTDSMGTSAQNARLARDRATAVSRYMSAIPGLIGVPMEIEARGMCCYLASNVTESGRRLNRRVDIALIETALEETP